MLIKEVGYCEACGCWIQLRPDGSLAAHEDGVDSCSCRMPSEHMNFNLNQRNELFNGTGPIITGEEYLDGQTY